MPTTETVDQTMTIRADVTQVRLMWGVVAIALIILAFTQSWLLLLGVALSIWNAFSLGVQRFHVDPDGVQATDPFGRSQSLPWSEVEAIDVEDPQEWRRVFGGKTTMTVVGTQGERLPIRAVVAKPKITTARRAVVAQAGAHSVAVRDLRSSG